VLTKNKSKDLSQRNSIGGISPQHFHHHKNQYSYFINSLAKHRRIYIEQNEAKLVILQKGKKELGTMQEIWLPAKSRIYLRHNFGAFA
jgi:hypothetical protein